MSRPGRLCRAWLSLVSQGSADPGTAPDLHAFAQAVQTCGPHELELGRVTFVAPGPTLVTGPPSRVPIGHRDDGRRLEIDPADGSVWSVDDAGKGERAYEDLEDVLATYYAARQDRSGLREALAAIDHYDQYLAGDAGAARRTEAQAAAASGAIGFLPTADVAESSRDAALSPSGRQRLTTHPVRTRCVDLGSGDATTVLEGWWQVGSVWLSEAQVAVLCSEGPVELDRSDPEVASLSSLQGAGVGPDGKVQVHSAGLLHVLDAKGAYRYPIEVVAEQVTASPDGRLVAVTRTAPRPGTWGTVLLASTEAGLVVIAKHPADIGAVVARDGRTFGSSGFELLGVDPVLDSVTPGRVTAIADSLAIDEPAPPPPATIAIEGATALALSRAADAPRAQRTADEPPAPPPGGEPSADVTHGSLSPDGSRWAIAAGDEVWDVDPGGTEWVRVWRSWPRVLSLHRCADAIWLLVQVFRAACEVMRFERGPSGWRRTASLPVEGLDRLYVGARGRLLVATIDHAPTQMAWSVLLGLDERGALLHLGRMPHATVGLWDHGDEVFVELLGGHTYEVKGIADAIGRGRELEDRSPRALVFDVKGGWGVREFLPRYDHDYGYLDRNGEVVIEHQYTTALDFEGGHGRVAHAGPRLFGLVGPDGACVVPHHYSWIGPLACGCRRVGRGEPDILGGRPESATWGLLRADGTVVLPPTERLLRDMSDGFSAVQGGDGRWNLVNRRGERLLEQSLRSCGDFSEGRCAARSEQGWGFVDQAGCWVIEPQFSEVRPFRQGLAAVAVAASRFRFVSTDGRWLGDETYDEVDLHQEDRAAVRRGKRWGYVDRDGHLVIEPRFDQAFRFHDGMAAVRMGDQWTWIDRTGKPLSPPRFDRTFDACEGIGVFQQGARRGYLAASGDVLAEGFDSAHDFVDGRAPVQLRGRWGFLDETGDLVVPPRFTRVLAFSEGLAAVRLAGAWGYVDRSGAIVIPPRLGTCGSFHEGRAVVHRGR